VGNELPLSLPAGEDTIVRNGARFNFAQAEDSGVRQRIWNNIDEIENDDEGVVVKVEISAMENQVHDVIITGEHMLRGNRAITIKYDVNMLEIYDLSAFAFGRVIELGRITGTNIEIIELDENSGIIGFRVNVDVPGGKVFTGVLNIIRFKGRESGSTEIKIT